MKVLEEDSQEFTDTSLTEGIKLYRDIKDTLMSSLEWSRDMVLNRDQKLLGEAGYKTIIDLLLKRIRENNQKGQ